MHVGNEKLTYKPERKESFERCGIRWAYIGLREMRVRIWMGFNCLRTGTKNNELMNSIKKKHGIYRQAKRLSLFEGDSEASSHASISKY
jgi:hypothetical protein